MDNKGLYGGIGIGFFMGVAVGVAVGMVYAPHSGKITRGLMEERVREATKRAEEILEDARDKAGDIVKKASKR